VVFQRYSVFPHLTALQNTMFGIECAKAPLTARLFGPARRAAREEAVAMLEAVGLGHSLDQYPAELSGGMQQRLAFAQALIKRPRILLLDEPFGALDPGIRADMHALVRRLWREHGLTIMMVTHDLREAFSLGTRVLAIDKVRHDPHAPTALAPRWSTTCPCASVTSPKGLKGPKMPRPKRSLSPIRPTPSRSALRKDPTMSSEPASLARLSMSLPADLFRKLDMMVEERQLPRARS
jgi:energy-coupling factor transporter ATP-binding protein EcfA2